MGKIFSDYSKIDMSTPEGIRMFYGAIQHNWNVVRELGEKCIKLGIQEFTEYSNFPDDIAKVIEKYHIDIAEIDRGYDLAYATVDLRNTQASSFRIRDVSSALTFLKVKTGERAKIYGVSGNVVDVSLDLYGGGLQWAREWFMDNEWWTIEDTALEFRRKWFEDKAVVLYDLIQSLTDGSDQNVPYDTAGATVVDKDINTINAGVLELIIAHRDTGLGVNAQTPFVLLVPIQNKGRVERAILGTYGAQNPGGSKVTYNVQPFYTPYLDWNHVSGGSSDWTDHVVDDLYPLGYLCVPKRKNKLGERMDLTVLSETDITAFADKSVGWGRYGAAIDEAQWRRLLSG